MGSCCSVHAAIARRITSETETCLRRAMRSIRFLVFASSLKVRGEAILLTPKSTVLRSVIQGNCGAYGPTVSRLQDSPIPTTGHSHLLGHSVFANSPVQPVV